MSVRSQKEKDALADGETYEKFHPNFTYPVSRRLFIIFTPGDLDLKSGIMHLVIRRRGKNLRVSRPRH